MSRLKYSEILFHKHRALWKNTSRHKQKRKLCQEHTLSSPDSRYLWHPGSVTLKSGSDRVREYDSVPRSFDVTCMEFKMREESSFQGWQWFQNGDAIWMRYCRDLINVFEHVLQMDQSGLFNYLFIFIRGFELQLLHPLSAFSLFLFPLKWYVEFRVKEID